MAARYWVGGSGTWDASDTTHWSATTGGAGGASAPTAADTVNFDASSGTAAVVTVTATAVSLSTTINKSDINLSLSGNVTLCTAAGTLTLTAGTITLNNNVLTCGFFTAASATAKTLAFGTGSLNVSGNNGFVYDSYNAASEITITGTPTVNCTYAGSTGTRRVQPGLTQASSINLNITAGTDIFRFASGFPFLNVNFTGFSGTWSNFAFTLYGNLTISSGMTVTAGTAVLTCAATSGIQLITTNGKTLDFPITQNGVGGTVQLQDNLTMGSTRTFTLTNGDLHINNQTLSTGLFSSSNSNVRTIDFKSGNITVTGNNTTVWTTSTITNFSYAGTPTVNFTYAGAVGTRQITTGNGTEAQVLNYNITAGTDGIGFISAVRSLNFTGFSGPYNQATTQLVAYRNVTFSAGMTITGGTGTLYFYSVSSTQNLTTNGKTINCPIIVGDTTQAPTLVCQDALTQGSTRNFTVTNGTIQLKNGVTSTVGAFATSGTKPKFLQSTTPGSQATLSQASGTVNASYLTIQDITAIGGATFNAYTDQSNVDAGNVDGWDFGISPIIGGAEYTYALRSFTQHGRF
jgi:hypothetical protein